MKLLLDENLSPTIAIRLREDECIDAIHVRDRDMLGATDEEVFARAFAEDRVLVTINVRDFVKLGRGAEVHAGLVLIEMEGDDSMLRDEQLACVKTAVEAMRGQDMANRALRVASDGTVTFEAIASSP